MLNKSRCRACGAGIWWLKTTAGKRMPMSDQPVAFVPGDGKKVFYTEDGVQHHGRRWTQGEDVYHDMGYESHFATCPEAGAFRRKKAQE